MAESRVRPGVMRSPHLRLKKVISKKKISQHLHSDGAPPRTKPRPLPIGIAEEEVKTLPVKVLFPLIFSRRAFPAPPTHVEQSVNEGPRFVGEEISQDARCYCGESRFT